VRRLGVCRYSVKGVSGKGVKMDFEEFNAEVSPLVCEIVRHYTLL